MKDELSAVMERRKISVVWSSRDQLWYASQNGLKQDNLPMVFTGKTLRVAVLRLLDEIE